MANRETFFYKEVLKEERLNGEFGNLEQAVWSAMADQNVIGILSGGAVAASVSTTEITVNPFAANDGNGRRMILGVQTVFNFALDYAGVSTTPSAGNYRWVAAILRYGKLGSSPVTDGDGATVYTVESEGFSATGDVTVDSGLTNFGKLRFVSGTQSGSPSTANRPAVTAPDIVLCDLLVDDTGKVHGGQAGVSYARTALALPSSRTALAATGTNYDATKYILLEVINLFGNGVALRKYAYLPSGILTPSLVFTVNAGWDPINNLWAVDSVGLRALLIEMSTDGLAINMRNLGGTTWTDDRHLSTGWDARSRLLAQVANADVLIDAGGTITGTGPQNTFAALGFTSDAGPNVTSVGFTYPQQMAAVPSSLTLSLPVGSDVNITSVSAVAISTYGGVMNIHATATNTSSFCQRRIIANP